MSSGFQRVLTALRNPRALVLLPVSSLMFMQSRQVGRCKGRALITYTSKKQEELNSVAHYKEAPIQKALLCFHCQEKLKGKLFAKNHLQTLEGHSRETLKKARQDLGSLLDNDLRLDNLAKLLGDKHQGDDHLSKAWLQPGLFLKRGQRQASFLDILYIEPVPVQSRERYKGQTYGGKNSKYLAQNMESFGMKYQYGTLDPNSGRCSVSLISGQTDSCVVYSLLNMADAARHETLTQEQVFNTSRQLKCDGVEDSKAPEEDPDKTPADVLFKAQEYINEKMPTIISQQIEFDVFHDDMVFVNAYDDPHEILHGKNRFKKWLLTKKMKVKLLQHKRLEVMSSMVDVDSSSITVRWRLAGIPLLRSLTSVKRKEDIENWYDGIAVFHVDKNGYIYQLRVDRRETMRRKGAVVTMYSRLKPRPKPIFSPT